MAGNRLRVNDPLYLSAGMKRLREKNMGRAGRMIKKKKKKKRRGQHDPDLTYVLLFILALFHATCCTLTPTHTTRGLPHTTLLPACLPFCTLPVLLGNGRRWHIVLSRASAQRTCL